jgi:transposase
MSKRLFTKEQIKELLENKNVAQCSERSITYSKHFKLSAVRLYDQGLTSTEIFRQANFDLQVIGKYQPKRCLQRWNKSFRRKGAEGLSETRGRNSSGRPKTKNLSEADKLKRLEAEVAYLKAENDFLAKLRARKAE